MCPIPFCPGDNPTSGDSGTVHPHAQSYVHRPSSRELMWHQSPKERGPDPRLRLPGACAPGSPPRSCEAPERQEIIPPRPPQLRCPVRDAGSRGHARHIVLGAYCAGPAWCQSSIHSGEGTPSRAPKKGEMSAHWRSTSEGHDPRHRPRKGEDLS